MWGHVWTFIRSRAAVFHNYLIGTGMIGQVSTKQLWWIWKIVHRKLLGIIYMTTSHHNTVKPWAYFRYTAMAQHKSMPEVNMCVTAAWSQFHASLVRQWSYLLVWGMSRLSLLLSAPCSHVFIPLVTFHIQTQLKFCFKMHFPTIMIMSMNIGFLHSNRM